MHIYLSENTLMFYSCNFVQYNIEKNVIRSSLLDRSALEDSLAIYFIFSKFCTIYYEFLKFT
jgi:hypothetical protein